MGARVAIGATWMVGMRWGIRALGVISILILARLLVPDDFGLVALATAYIGVVEGLTAMPMGQALIRFRDADDRMYDTAWTLTAVRGIGIVVLMVASAIPVAGLMNDPRLEMVVYVVALKPFIEGLENPRFIDFQKELVFSRPAMLRIGVRLVQLVVTISAAFAFRSYWALVAGGLVSAVLRIPMTYVLKPYRPRATFAEVRRLIGFSGWLTSIGAVSTINVQMNKFVIGGMLNTATVGLYHLGQELSRLPANELLQPLARALFPGLSMLAKEPEKLRANALEATVVCGALILPLGIGLGLVAEDFVRLLLGTKWLEVVPMVQIMAPLLAAPSLMVALTPLMLTLAKTRTLFVLQCIHFIARVTFVVSGVYWYEFLGAIYGYAAVSVVDFLIRLGVLSRELSVSYFAPVLVAWRSLAASAAMAAAVLGLASTLPPPTDISNAAVALAAKVAIGAVTYGLVHVALWYCVGRPPGIEQRVLSHWLEFQRHRQQASRM